jgi:hypothetical protein
MTMTTYIGRIINGIERRIAELSADMLVETNEGTYGAAEAARKVGTGDPAHADYRVYESPDGTRRVAGCDPARAPGRARRLRADSAVARRAEVVRLRKLADDLRTWPSHRPLPAGVELFAAA